MGDMSFEEWQKAKPIPDTAANRAQFDEYTKLLGKDAPKYYTDFQKLKCNDKKAWEKLKEEARMERVIRNAPCKLTKKKFSQCFLKQGTKHAADLFGVGYTENDIRRLRYDIAKQFDISYAISKDTNKCGISSFDIIMQHGIGRTGRFITGWQIDKEEDLPRIITAFRRELKK